MTDTTIEQGSADWHAQRCGRATASRIKDILARTKGGGVSASRENYKAELVLERLTGVQHEGFQSAEMRWGKEQEPEAVTAYEFDRNLDTSKISFVDHPTIPMSGASPDRLVGDAGLLEVKCPLPKQHLAWLLGGTVPSEYVKQMTWQMACTGRRWCDFVSYHPRFPVPMQLFVVRLDRDATEIVRIEAEVRAFLAEVDDQMAEIAKRFPVVPLKDAAE